MSILRKGFRQSHYKNVLERNFTPKIDFYSKDYENLTDWEKRMDEQMRKGNGLKECKSNWIHFGSVKRNTMYVKRDGSRNYINCLNHRNELVEIKYTPKDNDWDGWDTVPLSQVRSSKMFEWYGSEDKILHLTSKQNWNQIRVHGLVSRIRNHTYRERGGKFYFVQSEDKRVLNSIGYGQIVGWCDDVDLVVLEIDRKGITGDLYGEDGNEYSTPLHMVLTNQKRIRPKFIKYHSTIRVSEEQYYQDREEFGHLKQDYISKSLNVDKESLPIMGVDFNPTEKPNFSKISSRPEYFSVNSRKNGLVKNQEKVEYKQVS